MNLKRYSSFLIVAILTFVIGVASAVLVGGVNPFPRMRVAHKKSRRCLPSLPGPSKQLTVYTVYRTDGTIVRAYEVDKPDGLVSLGATPEEIPPPPPFIKDVPPPPR